MGPEKLRDPVDVILWHSAIEVDGPVLPIIGDNVQLHGLLGQDHRIVLSIEEDLKILQWYALLFEVLNPPGSDLW